MAQFLSRVRATVTKVFSKTTQYSSNNRFVLDLPEGVLHDIYRFNIEKYQFHPPNHKQATKGPSSLQTETFALQLA